MTTRKEEEAKGSVGLSLKSCSTFLTEKYRPGADVFFGRLQTLMERTELKTPAVVLEDDRN